MTFLPKIKRYGPCVGLSFPALGRWKLELWWAPKQYQIPMHSHPNHDSELIFFWGHNSYFAKKNLRTGEWITHLLRMPWDIFRAFSVRAGDWHYFRTNNTGLLFINIEKWKPGVKPTSAAEDFRRI